MRDPLQLNAARFTASGTTDWSGSSGTESDRFPFRDKLTCVEDWWPVVYSVAVCADTATTPSPRPCVAFGFRPDIPDVRAAGTPPEPCHLILRRSLRYTTRCNFPALYVTNLGRGWAVPHVDGQPMSFFLDSDKAGQNVGLSAVLLWGWRRRCEL